MSKSALKQLLHCKYNKILKRFGAIQMFREQKDRRLTTGGEED